MAGEAGPSGAGMGVQAFLGGRGRSPGLGGRPLGFGLRSLLVLLASFGRQGCEAEPGGQGGHLGGGSGSLVANRLAFAMSRCEALQVPLGLVKCLVVLSSGGSYRTLSLL